MGKADAAVYSQVGGYFYFGFRQHADAAIEIGADHHVFVIGMYVERFFYPGDAGAQAEAQAENTVAVKRKVDIGENAGHVPDVLRAAGIAEKSSYSHAGIVIVLLPVTGAGGLQAEVDFAKRGPGLAQVDGFWYIGHKEPFMSLEFNRKQPVDLWNRILGAGGKKKAPGAQQADAFICLAT